MLFNSFEFIFFFTGITLLAGSYYFYMRWHWIQGQKRITDCLANDLKNITDSGSGQSK